MTTVDTLNKLAKKTIWTPVIFAPIRGRGYDAGYYAIFPEMGDYTELLTAEQHKGYDHVGLGEWEDRGEITLERANELCALAAEYDPGAKIGFTTWVKA